jgi:hypothetical protein
MVVGLKGYQNDASLGLGFILTQPFLREGKGEATQCSLWKAGAKG